MAKQRPETWTRVQRFRLRDLANTIGNQALRAIDAWPENGDGRLVKEVTENVTRRLHGQQSVHRLDYALNDLVRSVRDLEALSSIRFYQEHVAPAIVANAQFEKRSIHEHLQLAIVQILEQIEEYRRLAPPPPTAAELAAVTLNEVTPEQKIGPIKFAMVDGRLRVLHQAAFLEAADVGNAASARSELVCAADKIGEFLSTNNWDVRLQAEVEQLAKRMREEQDIIALGVVALSFQNVVGSLEEQLPGVWQGKLRGLSLGIGMYVAQFPEWTRFSDNAAMAEFSSADVQKLYSTGMELAEKLRSESTLVDPEVPQSLAFILETIRDPRRAAKRTMYAAIRTIENLVSAVVRSFGFVLGGVPEGGRTAVKVATATGLLYLMATVAAQVAPAAGRVLQVHWLGRVSELILDNLKPDAVN